MLIQILLLVAIVAVTYLMGRSGVNARHMAFRRLFLLAFVAVAALAVTFPHLLTHVAGWFGVGRGADLLLYLTVIAFIGSLAMQSRRAMELGRKVTLLTRRMAILEAESAMGALGAEPTLGTEPALGALEAAADEPAELDELAEPDD